MNSHNHGWHHTPLTVPTTPSAVPRFHRASMYARLHWCLNNLALHLDWHSTPCLHLSFRHLSSLLADSDPRWCWSRTGWRAYAWPDKKHDPQSSWWRWRKIVVMLYWITHRLGNTPESIACLFIRVLNDQSGKTLIPTCLAHVCVFCGRLLVSVIF